jgi:hypothetical protein
MGWTAENCEQGLRDTIDRVGARTGRPVVNPFAALTGEGYVIASWYWLVKESQSWPACHREPAIRIWAAEGGQKWVCWGDLRTEYLKTEDLRAYLKNLKD